MQPLVSTRRTSRSSYRSTENMSSPLIACPTWWSRIEIDSKESSQGISFFFWKLEMWSRADMRLRSSFEDRWGQASLQGNGPSWKDVTGPVEADAGIGDRVNMGYQSLNRNPSGRGTGGCGPTQVCAAAGKIADMGTRRWNETPLKFEQL